MDTYPDHTASTRLPRLAMFGLLLPQTDQEKSNMQGHTNLAGLRLDIVKGMCLSCYVLQQWNK